jgi:large subunit ribosomal protein L15
MSMTHEITTGALRNKLPKRKGRGESSGHGKTSGRGNKGSKARVGTYIKRGYEGGQTQIFVRLPKRGFSNENFERRFYVVNLTDLEKFPAGTAVDAAALIEAGLVPDDKLPVKILGDGKFTKKLTITAAKFSHGAYDQIAKVGGSAMNLKGEPFAYPKEKKKFIPREPVKKSKKTEEAPAEEAAKPEAKAQAKPEAKPAADAT